MLTADQAKKLLKNTIREEHEEYAPTYVTVALGKLLEITGLPPDMEQKLLSVQSALTDAANQLAQQSHGFPPHMGHHGPNSAGWLNLSIHEKQDAIKHYVTTHGARDGVAQADQKLHELQRQFGSTAFCIDEIARNVDTKTAEVRLNKDILQNIAAGIGTLEALPAKQLSPTASGLLKKATVVYTTNRYGSSGLDHINFNVYADNVNDLKIIQRELKLLLGTRIDKKITTGKKEIEYAEKRAKNMHALDVKEAARDRIRITPSEPLKTLEEIKDGCPALQAVKKFGASAVENTASFEITLGHWTEAEALQQFFQNAGAKCIDTKNSPPDALYDGLIGRPRG